MLRLSPRRRRRSFAWKNEKIWTEDVAIRAVDWPRVRLPRQESIRNRLHLQGRSEKDERQLPDRQHHPKCQWAFEGKSPLRSHFGSKWNLEDITQQFRLNLPLRNLLYLQCVLRVGHQYFSEHAQGKIQEKYLPFSSHFATKRQRSTVKPRKSWIMHPKIPQILWGKHLLRQTLPTIKGVPIRASRFRQSHRNRTQRVNCLRGQGRLSETDWALRRSKKCIATHSTAKRTTFLCYSAAPSAAWSSRSTKKPQALQHLEIVS